MRRVRKTALALFIGLTAICTLLAGTPHIQCRCPNGRLKLFCLSSSTKTSKCCCDGSCCGSAEGSAETAPSNSESHCCCGNRQNSDETGTPPSTGPSLQENGCSKKLVLPEMQTSPDRRVATTNIDDVLPGVAFRTFTSPDLDLPAAQDTRWQVFRVPPPTDLCTVFQRLTI